MPFNHLSTGDIKQVPNDEILRKSIRSSAGAIGSSLDKSFPLSRQTVENRARHIIKDLNLTENVLGFTMVAVSNEFWHEQFAAVPFHRRLLCLPTCLRDSNTCAGKIDGRRLECAGCDSCVIDGILRTANELGYQTLIAEGTPDVILRIMEDKADAILGVACLDSLEKAFSHVADLGIPYQAVPLLNDGCRATETEPEELLRLIKTHREQAGPLTLSYTPLLRETTRVFTRAAMAELLSPYMQVPAQSVDATADPMTATEVILLDWLDAGGKRLRPFATAAAYAVGKHGSAMLNPSADLTGVIPLSVRKLCLAIESLHKASLVHDDIEDDDNYRYGRPALHRQHGIGPALNVGDYLVGLGYRLVAGESETLGVDCVIDIQKQLLSAHTELCRGQGAELMWRNSGRQLKPIDALSIYAMKTAPAFESALYAGLRAADETFDRHLLRRYSICLGEGYQILNDLDDWKTEKRNNVRAGQDIIAKRPTVLRAFALEMGGEDAFRDISGMEDGKEFIDCARAIYERLGVFSKAETMVDKLRSRAEALADMMENPSLGDLLHFFVKIALS